MVLSRYMRTRPHISFNGSMSYRSFPKQNNSSIYPNRENNDKNYGHDKILTNSEIPPIHTLPRNVIRRIHSFTRPVLSLSSSLSSSLFTRINPIHYPSIITSLPCSTLAIASSSSSSSLSFSTTPSTTVSFNEEKHSDNSVSSVPVTTEEWQQFYEQVKVYTNTDATSSLSSRRTIKDAHNFVDLSSSSGTTIEQQRLIASLIIWYEDIFQRYLSTAPSSSSSSSLLLPTSTSNSLSSSPNTFTKYRYTSLYTSRFQPNNQLPSTVSVPVPTDITLLSLPSIVSVGMQLWVYCSRNRCYTQSHLLWGLFRSTFVQCAPYLSSRSIEEYFYALFTHDPYEYKSLILIHIEKLIMMMDKDHTGSGSTPGTTVSSSALFTSFLLQMTLYCCSLDNNLTVATEIWSTIVTSPSTSKDKGTGTELSPSNLLVPTIHDYNALLYVIMQCGTANEALQVLKSIEQTTFAPSSSPLSISLRPNELTYNYIFETVGKMTPGIYKVLSLYDEMVNKQSINPTSLTFATLFNLPFTRSMYQTIHEHNNSSTSFTPMFSGNNSFISSRKYARYIKDVHQLMNQANIIPDTLIYTALTRFYLASGDIPEGILTVQKYYQEYLLPRYQTNTTDTNEYTVLPSSSQSLNASPSILQNLTYYQILLSRPVTTAAVVTTPTDSILSFTNTQVLQPYIQLSNYLLQSLVDDRRYHAYLSLLYHELSSVISSITSVSSSSSLLLDYVVLSSTMIKSCILIGNFNQAMGIFSSLWFNLTKSSLHQTYEFHALPSDSLLVRYRSTLTPLLTEIFRTLLRGRYLYPENIRLHNPEYMLNYNAVTNDYYQNEDILNMLEVYRYYISSNTVTTTATDLSSSSSSSSLPQSLLEATCLAGNDKMDLPLVHTIILSLEEEKVSGTSRMYEGALLTVYKTLQIMYNQYLTEIRQQTKLKLETEAAFIIPHTQRKYYSKVMGNLIDRKDDIFTMAQDIVKNLLGSGIVCKSTLTALLLYIDNLTVEILELQKIYAGKNVGNNGNKHTTIVNDNDDNDRTDTDNALSTTTLEASSRSLRSVRRSRTVSNRTISRQSRRSRKTDETMNSNHDSTTNETIVLTSTVVDENTQLETAFNELRTLSSTLPKDHPSTTSMNISLSESSGSRKKNNKSHGSKQYADDDILEEGIQELRKREQKLSTSLPIDDLDDDSDDDNDDSSDTNPEEEEEDNINDSKLETILQASINQYLQIVPSTVSQEFTANLVMDEPLMGTIDFGNEEGKRTKLEPVYIARLRAVKDLGIPLSPYYEEIIDKEDEHYAEYADMQTDKQLLQEIQNSTNGSNPYNNNPKKDTLSSLKVGTSSFDFFDSRPNEDENDDEDDVSKEIVLDGDKPIPVDWGTYKSKNTEKKTTVSTVVTKETSTKSLAKKMATRDRYSSNYDY